MRQELHLDATSPKPAMSSSPQHLPCVAELTETPRSFGPFPSFPLAMVDTATWNMIMEARRWMRGHYSRWRLGSGISSPEGSRKGGGRDEAWAKEGFGFMTRLGFIVIAVVIGMEVVARK